LTRRHDVPDIPGAPVRAVLEVVKRGRDGVTPTASDLVSGPTLILVGNPPAAGGAGMGWLGAYRDYLLCGGMADSTVANYVSYVTRWGRWASDHVTNPAAPTASAVRAWSHTLPVGVSSRDMAKGAMRRLCRWADVPDVSDAVARPEANTRNRRMPLKRTEAAELMAHALTLGDRGAVVVAGLLTGARVSELSRLRWSDFDWPAGVCRFLRPKTGGWHTVPIAATLDARLRLEEPARDGFVFPAPNEGRRSEESLRRWVTQTATEVGLPWVRPHDLRRTAGRSVYEAAGRDITAAQAFLGHSKSETTAVYIRADLDAVVSAVAAVDYFTVAVPSPGGLDVAVVAAA
jgi:integrase